MMRFRWGFAIAGLLLPAIRRRAAYG